VVQRPVTAIDMALYVPACSTGPGFAGALAEVGLPSAWGS